MVRAMNNSKRLPDPFAGALPLSLTKKTPMKVAQEAAWSAGAIIRDKLRHTKKVTFKGRANIVTDVDIMAENAVLEILRGEYPTFSVLSEESEPIETKSEYRWIVDPLDGSRNYASQVPHVAVAIALTRSDHVVLGVIYDPIRDETFTAQYGFGACLNGIPIYVSSNSSMPECLVGFDMGYVDKKGSMALELVGDLWPGIQSIRVMGSGALGLAYAACGRLDIYFHHHLYPWDIAAGLLLVSEAGGCVVDRKGKSAKLQSRSVIASSLPLVESFLALTEETDWRMVDVT